MTTLLLRIEALTLNMPFRPGLLLQPHFVPLSTHTLFSFIHLFIHSFIQQVSFKPPLYFKNDSGYHSEYLRTPVLLELTFSGRSRKQAAENSRVVVRGEQVGENKAGKGVLGEGQGRPR